MNSFNKFTTGRNYSCCWRIYSSKDSECFPLGRTTPKIAYTYRDLETERTRQV